MYHVNTNTRSFYIRDYTYVNIRHSFFIMSYVYIQLYFFCKQGERDQFTIDEYYPKQHTLFGNK